MSREIPNSKLSSELLPDATDRNNVFSFAMSFDGYKHYGSFERSADEAKSKRRDSLTSMRNELFFEARASRHRGDDKFLDVYRELLPLIKGAIDDKDA